MNGDLNEVHGSHGIIQRKNITGRGKSKYKSPPKGIVLVSFKE